MVFSGSQHAIIIIVMVLPNDEDLSFNRIERLWWIIASAASSSDLIVAHRRYSLLILSFEPIIIYIEY